MDALLSAVRTAAATADEAARKKLLDGLRDLQYSIEKPEDTMQRAIHLQLVLSIIRLGVEVRLFNALAESEAPLSVAALADKTGVEPSLMGRVLRMLASLGYVGETAEDEFSALGITRNLAIPEIQSGVIHNFDVFGPVYQHLPEYLKSTSYQPVTSLTDGVFQSAWKRSGDPLWVWLHESPRLAENFNLFMKAQRSSTPNCFDFYSLAPTSPVRGADDPRPVFVDVGGGSGHQCAALARKYPDLAGKIVLQDLAQPIADAKSSGILPTGVTATVHDFFTPQPVVGAKYYYLRAVLHDHADHEAARVLANLTPALAEDSLVLLDEMVLPATGVDWYATQTDLTMMCAHGARERTEGQWRALLADAGLEVRSVTTYTHSFRLSVIAAGKKGDKAPAA